MSIESIPIEGMTYSQLKIINDGGDYKNGIFVLPYYMAINFWEIGKVSLIRLTNMKASMKIIEKMTQKYNVSFHLIFGNEKEISTVDVFKKVFDKRNKKYETRH
jgi:hypothetical protein